MKAVRLLRIGPVDRALLDSLGAGLQRALSTRCELDAATLDPDFAFHPGRGQFHSTDILRRMSAAVRADSTRLLGITEVDLFIPILTFVFGEAQMGDSCAIVSFYRLRQEFYGLPPDAPLLEQRLLKEAVHELGHTLGLAHCDDYRCAMAPSHGVEWIDLKGSFFCAGCRARSMASALAR